MFYITEHKMYEKKEQLKKYYFACFFFKMSFMYFNINADKQKLLGGEIKKLNKYTNRFLTKGGSNLLVNFVQSEFYIVHNGKTDRHNIPNLCYIRVHVFKNIL